MDLKKLEEQLGNFSQHLLIAFVTLVVGWFLIKFLSRLINRGIETSVKDVNVAGFIKSAINIVLKVLLFVAVAGKLGIQTASFAAILGAISLAIGLSLQGSLANFAGGVLLLVLKPYKIGDYVMVFGSNLGYVREIQIFTTILITTDNKMISVPNGVIFNNPIVNLSSEKNRRNDINVKINKIETAKAREVIMSCIKTTPGILQDNQPEVYLQNTYETSSLLAVRFWTSFDGMSPVRAEFLEKMQQALLKEGITVLSAE